MNTTVLDTQQGSFRVYTEGTVTRALQNGQWWDEHLKALLDSVPAGGVALDIGAHVGWFTRYLANRHVVCALEPWPETFALLLENVKHCPDVCCWPVAAHSHTGTLWYSSVLNNAADAGSFAFIPTNLTGAPVVCVRLDRYLPEDADVRVIKCDAQGGDLAALQGLRETIERCRPLILFEWEETMAAAHRHVWGDYLEFFAAIGYDVRRISDSFWDYVARPK